MLLKQQGFSIFDNKQGSSQTSALVFNLNFVFVLVIVDIDVFRNFSFSAGSNDALYKLCRVFHVAHIFAVHVHFCHRFTPYLSSYSYFTTFNPYSFNTFTMPSSPSCWEISASMARFFLKPILVPSGVSTGHNIPMCVG